MPPTISPSLARRRTASPRAMRQPTRPVRPAAGSGDVLGRYHDDAGRLREVVTCPGAGGSVLVIDRDAATLGDRRLVAHLGADEPAGNAALVCACYLRGGGTRGCRRVAAHDLEVVPFADDGAPAATHDADATLFDVHGHRYRLDRVPAAGMSIPELRWLRHPVVDHFGPPEPVSLRDAIGALEDYEPARTLSATAVGRCQRDRKLSVAVLRAELERVTVSRIVLNRGLREAVLNVSSRDGLSMSEIAVRCGRIKRDARGNISGETSWLARRLGLLPEGGERVPTPWVHSDVLALIARRGLGISPREVELG
jgi:hypothetical protein